MSDADLLAANAASRAAAREQAAAATDDATVRARGKRAPTKLSTYLRTGFALALGVGMLFWPYDTRCGFGLFGYLLAAALLSVAGTWSALSAWRMRAGTAHIVSVGLIAWGIVLGAAQILPRIGYAIPSEAHPAGWVCQ
jgi:hypothetical protein